MKTRFLISAVAFCALPWLAAAPAYAGSAAWSGQLNSNWNVFQNWSPQTVPNGPSDAATLGSSFNRTVYLSANTEVNSITFPKPISPFAVNYGITVSTNLTLTISGTGITNNSGQAQNFVVAASDGTNSALTFQSMSSYTCGLKRTTSSTGQVTAVAGKVTAFGVTN